MNYYIQGDPNRATEIRAAFERNGYDISWPGGCANPDVINIGVERNGAKYVVAETSEYIKDIIKTHPDYMELPLPKPHYDISNFKPFDKVLTRDTEHGNWNVNLFSYYIDDEDARVVARFRCMNSLWHQCIPFNDDTKHLLGTANMCDECYINW